MTRKLVVANWKMWPETYEEAAAHFEGIKKTAMILANVDVVLCPPAIYLHAFSKRLALKKKTPSLWLGAQDSFWETSGAFTGELSPTMLFSAGSRYVLLGHSERRAMGEKDGDIAKKVNACLRSGLSVILCVGEEARDEDASHFSFLSVEIEEALKKTQKKFLSHLLIAYEPIWAVSTKGRGPATEEEVFEMRIFIRKTLVRLYGKEIASRVPILYGGSVDKGNARVFLDRSSVDGLLVGRESLDVDSFSKLLTTIDHG